jgi:hypothetical protein
VHQLGYELPERTGFAGLWQAVDDAAEVVHATAGDVECEAHLVARCDGAAEADHRAAIAAFRRTCGEDVAA